MGQYYKFIILADTSKKNKECILLVLNPHAYNEGAKLTEHSYMNTNMMNVVEYLISKHGRFYKSRIVWAGDYANPEDSDEEEGHGNKESINLYRLADFYSSYEDSVDKSSGGYIVNHTKRLYVDKERQYNENNNIFVIHPLPLLISEGNGRGGGDYRGSNEHLCGTWARDVISIEQEIPDDYKNQGLELICDFEEY